jgi:SAM-dependent methyltransferase
MSEGYDKMPGDGAMEKSPGNDKPKITEMALRKTQSAFLIFTLVLVLVCFPGCRKSLDGAGELDRLAGDTTDKASSGHGFLEFYERFFQPIKNSATKVFEIGISEGASLVLWEKYFPKATVYGIDILDKSALESKRIKTFVADQADRSQLAAFIDKFGGDFDFILDDGGHTMPQQQISFGFLFQYVRPGGYYIIEDLHTSLPGVYPTPYVKEGGVDSTLRMLFHFIETRQIESQYMTFEEKRYLRQDVEYVALFQRNVVYPSITSIIKKKKD